MSLVVPLASTAGVIENILFKVRRGIALSRNATQTDPTTGVMVDLPESIDFEMTVLKTHQSQSHQRGVTTIDSSADNDSANTSSNSSKLSNSSETSLRSTLSVDFSNSLESENNQDLDLETGLTKKTSVSSTKQQDLSTLVSLDLGNNKGIELEVQNQSTTENGSENEAKCTLQDHTAHRNYDMFDTDIGTITGISI